VWITEVYEILMLPIGYEKHKRPHSREAFYSVARMREISNQGLEDLMALYDLPS